MIERCQTSTCEIPAAAVFSIPDVGLDESRVSQGADGPSVVTRVGEQKLSKAGKTIVLFGVFLFYAMIGVLAAKVVVWVCGTPGENANIVENKSVDTEWDEPLKVATPPTPLFKPQLTKDIRQKKQLDPAISKQLRTLLMDPEANEMESNGYSGSVLMTAKPSREKRR